VIWELIVSAFMALVRAIVSLIPSIEPPAWLGTGAAYISDALAMGSGLGGWLNFSVAGTVLAAVLACVAVGFSIKLVRIVAAFFTGGGGSAA